MFYDNIIAVCRERGTTPTTVLKECGFSAGNMSKWKHGSVPNVDMCVTMAAHLGVSLDYLVTGVKAATDISRISPEQQEWLDIISLIPEEKHAMLKDFLRTHMVVPEKYANREKA